MRNMSEKETYVCKDCSMECSLSQKSEMERQFPTICPHGMIAHYEKVNWKRKVKR